MLMTIALPSSPGTSFATAATVQSVPPNASALPDVVYGFQPYADLMPEADATESAPSDVKRVYIEPKIPVDEPNWFASPLNGSQ